MIELISKPWSWYIAGPLIALVMFLLLYEGKNFGMSSNLRTLCSMGGAGSLGAFFRYDWKSQRWNLVVVLGALIGGFIGHYFLTPDTTIDLNSATIASLKGLGFESPGTQYVPPELFGYERLFSIKGFGLLALGGFLVGFGARYAGGCTSGHAISGLSNLQIPSLIAVIGFFIGGLLMTHFLLPILLTV